MSQFTINIFLLLLFFPLHSLAAATEPWEGGGTPICSTECTMAAPKLSYIPGKTYFYFYTCRSNVELKGMEEGISKLEWKKQVELTWLSPCDVAINVNVTGSQNGTDDRFLQKYPLVAAISGDGRIHHVCSHPKDESWSINIKKGIASIFQNSLPSFSTMRSPQNLTEMDVIGNCSTKYQVEGEGSHFVVTKEKNHRQCQQRYYSPSETHVPWLKAPLPIQESWSKCTQEISNGIYTSFKCEDVNVVKPMYGSYKFVRAKQESELRYQYQSMNNNQSHYINWTISQVELVKQSLNYDYQEQRKNQSLIPYLEQALVNICHKTMKSVERDTARVMAQVIYLMRRVPQNSLPQFLKRIRSKQICPDNNPKLESLFLDAITFVQESGSINIMADEIASGRVTNGRSALYAAAFYMMSRPNLIEVQALIPVFELQQPVPSVFLTAASLVNTYCRRVEQCATQGPVQTILISLNSRLQGHCSPLTDVEEQMKGLITFKVLGNLGVMSSEVATTAIRCVRTEGLVTSVRVAAAQAFRLVPCHQMRWRALLGVTLDKTLKAEVRVAAYLAGIRCASRVTTQELVNRLTTMEDTHVRGFVFSHLHNLLKTEAPDKQHLRYRFINIALPSDYEEDLRKYSRNIDLSYWETSLGVGAGLESNIVYSPGSFVPRSLDFNLTAALDGFALNIGELGARIQGLEPILAQVFGPGGYFVNSSYGQIFQDIARLVFKGEDIMERWQDGSDRASLLASFLSKIYFHRESEVQGELYFRYKGQELAFASITEPVQELKPVRLRSRLVSFIHNFFSSLTDINTDSGRTLQVDLDYSFPTIQGTPFKLQLVANTVAGLKIQKNLPLILSGSPHEQNTLNFSLSFSTALDGFVGYDSHISQNGIRTKNLISNSNGVSIIARTRSNSEVQLELELPQRMEMINMESETYLMKRMNESVPETKITPPSMIDTRTILKSCITTLESSLGLKMCYDVDLPNIFLSNSLPLVSRPVTAKLMLDKFDPAMKGYLINADFQRSQNLSKIVFIIQTYGSKKTIVSDASVTHMKEINHESLTLYLHGSNVINNLSISWPTKEGESGVEVFYSYVSEDVDFSRCAKFSLTHASTVTSEALECFVYYGANRLFPPESQVFEGMVNTGIQRPNRVSVDTVVRTMNYLTDYMEFDLEAGGELEYRTSYHLLVPVKLHKMEFRGGLGTWKVVSFLRKTSELGTTQMKGEFTLYDQVNQKGATLQVLQPSTYSPTPMHLDASSTLLSLQTLYIQTGPSYVLKFLATPDPEKDSILLECGINSGSVTLLQVFGPSSVVLTHSLTNIQTELAVMTNIYNSTRRFFFGGNFTIRNNAQVISLKVLRNQHPIFVFKLDTSSPQSDMTVINTSLILPVYIKFQATYRVTPWFLNLDFKSLLLPGLRRIKGQLEYVRLSGKGSGQLWWESNRGLVGNASAQAVFIQNKPQQPMYSILGRVRIPGNSPPVSVWLCADLGATSHANSYGLLIAFPEGPTHVMELSNDVGKGLGDAEPFLYGDRSTSFPFADDKVAIALLKRLMNTFLGDDSIPYREWDSDSTLFVPDVHYHHVATLHYLHYNFTPYALHQLPALNTHKGHYKPLLLDSIPLEPLSLSSSHYHTNPEPFYSKTYMRYKNINTKREYKCLIDVGWEPQRDTNQGFLLSTRINYKLPNRHNTTFSSKLHYKASSRISFINLKGQIFMLHPDHHLYFNYTWFNSPNLFRVVLQANNPNSEVSTTPSLCSLPVLGPKPYPQPHSITYNILEWDVAKSTTDEIRSFNISADLAAVKNAMLDATEIIIPPENMNQETLIGGGGEEDICGEGEDQTGCNLRRTGPLLDLYFCSRYYRSDLDTHTLLLKSPRAAVEAKYSPSEISLQFYPNRNVSSVKYEVSARSSLSYYGTKYEGRVSHPSINRDMAIQMEYSSNDTGIQGTFELDVLPDTADKLTGSLHSNFISNNTLRVEGNFTTRVLNFQPAMAVVVGVAPQTLAFDVAFKRNDSDLPLLSLITKYDNLWDSEATMTMLVAEKQNILVDLEGVVKQETGPQCMGTSLTLATFTSVMGRRNFRLASCHPGFIQLSSEEVVEGRENSGINWYEGVTPERYEPSSDVVSDEPESDVLDRGEPVSDETDEAEESNDLEKDEGEGELLDEALETYTATIGLLGSQKMEASVYKTVTRQETSTLALVQIKPTLPYLDFVYRQQHFNRWKDMVRVDSEAVWNGCVSWVEGLWHEVKTEARSQNITFPPPGIVYLTRMLHINYEFVHMHYEANMKPVLHELTRLVRSPLVIFTKKHVYKYWLFLRWLEADVNNDDPQVYTDHCYWKDQVNTYNFLVRAGTEKIITTIATGGEDIRESLEQVLEWVEGTRIYQLAKEDLLEKLVERLMNPEEMKGLQVILERMETQVEEDLEPLRDNPALIWLAVLSGGNVNTLVESVSLTPASTLANLLWSYNSYFSGPLTTITRFWDTLLPTHYTNLLPPFSRSAQVVGGTEILTFDGARLRVPRSPCRVILAAYDSSKISMSHPDPTVFTPELMVTTPDVVVLINNHFQVRVNGIIVMNRDVTVHGVFVRTSGLQITVALPFLTLKVSTDQQLVMVAASPWTYGRLAGLLGTFDGEASNDRLMSTGTWASSMRDLVASWQEDGECHTPPVPPNPPVTPSLERQVHCYPLLGVWARCNAIVRPEPYMNLCLVSPSPCDAAQAYRSLCTTKNIQPLISRGC
ncbi:hypothetical protein Pmani_024402 [Petrolisthes manimaculis]|uniref:Vitellogenin n=1 Tax=Petrolisthes manimaculis TaxID=1843537 RepID=A0AAE1TYQ5_9EUCA|nr:hypothetical protein Pmani_024402 [Petrolisthes manimaculis]